MTAEDPKKLIPLEKQSKRARREHAQSRRGDWGAVKPVLRVVVHISPRYFLL